MEAKTTIELLKQEVSVKDTIDSYPTKPGAWWKNTSIGSLLTTAKYLPLIEDIREKKNILENSTSPEEYEQNKKLYAAVKKQVPAWSVSGTFKYFKFNADSLITPNNLIILDIDKKTNPFAKTGTENADIDLWKLREELFQLPYVVAALKSVGGWGFYVIIYVEDYTKTTGYYWYLYDLYKQQYNVAIDHNTFDISRRRYLSYDEDYKKWIKPNNTLITPWKLYLEDKQISQIQQQIKAEQEHKEIISLLLDTTPLIPIYQKERNSNNLNNDPDYQMKRTHAAIWALLNNGYVANSIPHWIHIGRDFANFSDGKDMFDKISNNFGNYDTNFIDKTWDKDSTKKITPIDDNFHRKWQGMAKNTLGSDWWKIKQ